MQFQELIFSYRFSITAGNIQELHFQFWGIDNVIRLTRIVQFSTALEFVQVVSKQLRNLAVPTWMDDVPQGHFRVWVFVGDDGPNVSAGVRVINTLCEDSKNKRSSASCVSCTPCKIVVRKRLPIWTLTLLRPSIALK